MKKIKILYALLSVVGLFVIVLILAALQAPPPGEKTAQETNCVPSLLPLNEPLVNGLGAEVEIPLFPGAKRLTFTDATAVQYAAKAYDSDIKSFYDDRLTSLCWEIKSQSRDQIVYKNDGKELKLSLLPNPAGKTVIDYVVLTTEGVLGTVRIADHVAACATDQYYCNGACVANSTSCPAPASSADCTGGAVYCPNSSGGSGWCQIGSCPSSSTSSTNTTPTTSCSGSYQQSGSTYPSCNYSTCPNGCTWDSSGCPSGCYSSSSTTTTSCPSGQYMCNGACVSNSTSCGSSNTNTWPTDQASCTSQGKFWCTSQSSSGWCQSSSCPAGDYSYNTGGFAGDANSCPAFAYSRWDSTGKRYCQLNNERRCDYNYPSYTTNGGNYTAANCPATDTASGQYASCPAGQYSCNGTCINNSSSCSPTAWPTDQSSCTSQAKFWCTGSYSGSGSSGWCQSTACSTNYSTTTCGSGQWLCNNVCISTSSSCNGYNYSNTAPVATNTQTTWPTDKAACSAGGYFWCSGSGGSNGWCSASTCPNSVTSCPAGQWVCAGICISTAMQCDGYYYGEKKPQVEQPKTQEQKLTTPNEADKYAKKQVEYPEGQGPSDADMQRMKEEQFRQMKRGMDQFSRGVTQMKRFVDRAKASLARQGVGIPLELTNAMAKAPELLAKLKAAKNQDEFEDLMGDMQDIGMIMQEWGPKMGDLQRLGGMLSQLNRDVRNMTTNFNRIKRAAARRPELADAVKEVEAMLGVMGKKAADAKALAKSDPEGALDLVEDFYANSEEYWNTAAVVDMVANIQRGLTQANTEIRRAETRIRAIERAKQVDAETIATLKDMLTDIKAILPELKAVVAKRPLDYEEVKLAAEDFWAQIEEFENLLAEQGQSFYAPTVKNGANIKLDIPAGFLGATNNSGPQGTGSFEGQGSDGFGPGGF